MSDTSFGHHRELRRVPHWNSPDTLVWSPSCSARRCDEKPEYVTRYMYVTGRAGRVTDRIEYRCQAHGEAFAKKHNLIVPLKEAAQP